MDYQKIWEKTLITNEKIKHEFSISRRYRIFYFIFNLTLGFLVGLLLFAFLPELTLTFFSIYVLVTWFYFGFYLKVSHAYAFTNRRILVHRGWLSTHTTSINYNQITDIRVVEPFITRLLTGTGYLMINTAGTDVHEISLSHIAAPYEIKRKLEELKAVSI